MKNILKQISILLTLLFAASCVKDYVPSEGILDPEQTELIGRAVNFNSSWSDKYVTKASYYNTDGSFTIGDRMTVYREYKDGGSWGAPSYRVYSYYTTFAPGTDIQIKTEWEVLPYNASSQSDAIGGDYNKETHVVDVFQQSKADSLTWENGSDVRFRSWCRSNYAGAITKGKDYFYPDFSSSDWVTVSGPSQSVPLVLKHLGSRIMFSPKNKGTKLSKIEISTVQEDYRKFYVNVDSDDPSYATQLATADGYYNEVVAAYSKLCMPAGVNAQTGLLDAMSTSYYNASPTKNFINITEKIELGSKTASEVVTDIQRPVFTKALDDNCMFVTIPYDMSSENSGEALSLPSHTLFKIYLYDVNSGDNNTEDYELTFHFFSLYDVMDGERHVYEDGLPFTAGSSYTFQVGYHYNTLTVSTVSGFSWEEQNVGAAQAVESSVPELPSLTRFSWWKDAIATSAENAYTNSVNYNPEFHISSREEFLEFMDLVNGTTVSKLPRLYRSVRYTDASKTTVSEIVWYTLDNEGVATNISKDDAEAAGYVFYKHFTPQNATTPASILDDVLQGPFSFYDEGLSTRFKVYLDNDLDMADWYIEDNIGNSDSNPFRGAFDGQMHTISNLYVKGECLFGNIDNATICHLSIKSNHPSSLVGSATGVVRLLGITMDADCTGNPLAASILSGGADAKTRERMRSYVVGCTHIGDTGSALVGTADNLAMYGCLHAASGLTAASGSMLHEYHSDKVSNFFAPMSEETLEWGSFMCNYNDKSLSKNASAVGGIADDYIPQQYIRSLPTDFIRALYDNLLTGDVTLDKVPEDRRYGYYGLAPWKAMNLAIYRYNHSSAASAYPCNAHYVLPVSGYSYKYPELVANAPSNNQADQLDVVYSDIDVTELKN